MCRCCFCSLYHENRALVALSLFLILFMYFCTFISMHGSFPPVHYHFEFRDGNPYTNMYKTLSSIQKCHFANSPISPSIDRPTHKRRLALIRERGWGRREGRKIGIQVYICYIMPLHDFEYYNKYAMRRLLTTHTRPNILRSFFPIYIYNIWMYGLLCRTCVHNKAILCPFLFAFFVVRIQLFGRW